MNEDHSRDLELVQRAIAGRRDARREVARRMGCIGRILAVRNRRLGFPLTGDELDDVAQETALRVWTKLATYSGRAALETWVFRFCALEHLHALRRRGRRLERLPADDGVAGAEVPTHDECAHADSALDRMLRHLSDREGAVVRLRHVEQLAFHEIADALDITASSVKTHYYRAIEKLRTLFAPASEVGK